MTQDEATPFESSYLLVEGQGPELAALRVGHPEGLDLLRNYYEADARARAVLAAHLAEIVAGELLAWSDGSSASTSCTSAPPATRSRTATRARREQYDELVHDAGVAWDPGSWYVAYEGSEPVGVVLPQPYPDDPRGTIFYIGVLPAFRGRGLGATLHAFGLWRLKGRAASYVGSTDVRNAAMRRVFARSGCRETKRQLFYARAAAGA